MKISFVKLSLVWISTTLNHCFLFFLAPEPPPFTPRFVLSRSLALSLSHSLSLLHCLSVCLLSFCSRVLSFPPSLCVALVLALTLSPSPPPSLSPSLSLPLSCLSLFSLSLSLPPPPPSLISLPLSILLQILNIDNLTPLTLAARYAAKNQEASGDNRLGIHISVLKHLVAFEEEQKWQFGSGVYLTRLNSFCVIIYLLPCYLSVPPGHRQGSHVHWLWALLHAVYQRFTNLEFIDTFRTKASKHKHVHRKDNWKSALEARNQQMQVTACANNCTLTWNFSYIRLLSPTKWRTAYTVAVKLCAPLGAIVD